MQLDEFPIENIERIYSFLEHIDIKNMSVLSKKMHRITTSIIRRIPKNYNIKAVLTQGDIYSIPNPLKTNTEYLGYLYAYGNIDLIKIYENICDFSVELKAECFYENVKAHNIELFRYYKEKYLTVDDDEELTGDYVILSEEEFHMPESLYGELPRYVEIFILIRLKEEFKLLADEDEQILKAIMRGAILTEDIKYLESLIEIYSLDKKATLSQAISLECINSVRYLAPLVKLNNSDALKQLNIAAKCSTTAIYDVLRLVYAEVPLDLIQPGNHIKILKECLNSKNANHEYLLYGATSSDTILYLLDHYKYQPSIINEMLCNGYVDYEALITLVEHCADVITEYTLKRLVKSKRTYIKLFILQMAYPYIFDYKEFSKSSDAYDLAFHLYSLSDCIELLNFAYVKNLKYLIRRLIKIYGYDYLRDLYISGRDSKYGLCTALKKIF